MEVLMLFIALALIAIVMLWVVVRSLSRRRLSQPEAQRLAKEWERVLQQRDPHRRVLDGEKVLDHALKALGYRGTFAEKFKLAQMRVKNPEAVWSAHRLRNRIAHEMNVELKKGQVERAVGSFETALKNLGM